MKYKNIILNEEKLSNEKYLKLIKMRDSIPQLDSLDYDKVFESTEFPVKVICQIPYEGLSVTGFKTKKDADKFIKLSYILDGEYDWFGPFLITKV